MEGFGALGLPWGGGLCFGVLRSRLQRLRRPEGPGHLQARSLQEREREREPRRPSSIEGGLGAQKERKKRAKEQMENTEDPPQDSEPSELMAPGSLAARSCWKECSRGVGEGDYD